MREVTKKYFTKLEVNLKSNKQSYIIEAKRGQKYLFHNGKMVAKVRYKTSVETKVKSKSEQKKVLSIIANVKKSFSRFAKKNPDVAPIPQDFGSVYTDRISFKELPNDTELEYIDLNHCYWRIAHLLGYISERTYSNALDKPEMKLYRNMALSCTIAPKIIETHEYGKPPIIETENTTAYNIMYGNIRYFAWNIMGSLIEKLGHGKVFGYWTDGILVCKVDSQTVQDTFDEYNLLYSVQSCVKVSDREYKVIGKDKIKKV